MHEINCPWCGPRAQTEFEYVCRASAVEPDWNKESTQEALNRVFLRDDHIGFHEEVWQHVLGCRGWVKLERHNRSHEIRSSEAWRSADGLAKNS